MLNSTLRHFPWRLYKRFVFTQISFLAFVLITLMISVGRFLHRSAPIKVAAQADQFLLLATGLVLLLLLFFSLWIGHRFFLPLARLTVKARSLHSRRRDLISIPEEIEEWQELEAVLEQIQRDLRSTSDRLSRGRQEIKTLMNSISEAILAVDSSGHAVFFNQRFVERFGEERWETGRMPRLQEIFRAPDVLESFAKAIRDGVTVTLSTSLSLPLDRQSGDYDLSVSPLRVRETHEIYGALGIFHDITELKRAERIRIEFVGNASHELRTPLTSIKGYVETLISDLARNRFQDAEKFLKIIARNVDRLIDLVSDLLDLSSLEGSGRLKPEAVGVREMTEMVLRNLENQEPSRKKAVVCEYEVSHVHADPNKLEQVITNLLHNALKYVPEGKEIKISWRRTGLGEAQGVLLSVADRGPGIAKEHLSRLFERFYRVDQGRARDAGGTGLGLAIVKHICLRHGGWVKVESETGVGTRFTCFFPQPLSSR